MWPSIQIEKKIAFMPPSRMRRDVHVAIRIALAEVVALREETLRGVVVRVQDDRGKMQLVGPVGDGIGRSGVPGNWRSAQTKPDREQHERTTHDGDLRDFG